MAVRLSALRAGRALHPERFLVLIYVSGWVNLRDIVRMEGLGKFKRSNDVTGNRTCDLPACIAPQPATLPRAPNRIHTLLNYCPLSCNSCSGVLSCAVTQSSHFLKISQGQKHHCYCYYYYYYYYYSVPFLHFALQCDREWPPLWSSGHGSGTGSTQPREYNWGATW
jgi:hypothetical protein